MRPWFTLIVVFVIGICLVAFLWVVDFVLINREMFEMPFRITIRIPLSGWEHVWEGVQFVYIITASVLLGALIIAVTTLGLDTKRTLRLRSMRKELKRLQQTLQEAQAALPEEEPQEEQVAAEPQESEEPADEMAEPPSVSPEDISKSFEDAIEKDDFLEAAKKRREEDLEKNDDIASEGDVRERVTGGKTQASEQDPSDQHQEPQEDSPSVSPEEITEATPVEAELVKDGDDENVEESDNTEREAQA